MIRKKILKQNLIVGLEKLAQINRVLLWKTSKEKKISPIQIQFLEFIKTYPINYCTISQMASEFNLKKSTVSESILNLINKGILKKIHSETDRRKFYFQITSEGLKKTENIEEKQFIIKQLVDTLEEDELAIISKFLINLILRMQNENIISKTNLCLNCKNRIDSDLKEFSFYCKLTHRYFNHDDILIQCLEFQPSN